MPEPVFQRRPQAVRSFNRKWQRNAPELRGLLDEAQLRSLIQLDVDRVERGALPLSARESAVALRAIQSKDRLHSEPASKFLLPGPVGTFLGNVKDDVTDIVTSLPRLPAALVQEAQAVVGHRPEEFENARNVLESPGIRLIPGAFTLSNILEGTPEVLAEHPVMTGLDVLPYAQGASKLATGGTATIRGVEGGLGVKQLAGEGLHRTVGEGIRKATGRYPFKSPGFVKELTEPVIDEATGAVLEPAKTVVRGEVGPASWAEHFGFGRRNREIARGDAQQDRKLNQAREEFNKGVDEIWEGVSKEDKEQITRIANGTAEGPLSPEQLQIVARVGQIQEEIGQKWAAEGVMVKIEQPGALFGEWYDAPTAKKLLEPIKRTEEGRLSEEAIGKLYKRAASHENVIFAEEAIAGSRNPNLHRFADELADNVRDYRQSNALFHMFEELGYVDRDIVELFKGARRKTGDAYREDLRLALHQKIDDGTTGHLLAWDDPEAAAAQLAQDTFDLAQNASPKLKRPLLRANAKLTAGQWSKAVPSLRAAARHIDDADLAQLLDESAYAIERWGRGRQLVEQADKSRGRFRRQMADITQREEQRAKVLESIDKLTRKNPPARFQPMIQKLIGERVEKLALERGEAKLAADPGKVVQSPAEVQELVRSGLYRRVQDVPIDEVEKIAKEVAETWPELKAAGADPIYQHTVGSTGQVKQIEGAFIQTAGERKPTSVRKRSVDASPSIPDLSISLKHQGMEYLRYMHSKEYREMIERVHGRNRQQLEDEFWPIAQKLGEARGTEPAIELDNLIKREYSEWKADELFPFPEVRGTTLTTGGETFIPVGLQRTLSNLYKISHHPGVQGTWDIFTQTFRVSVLALSLRWHIYNMFGGAFGTLAETGFGGIREVPEAFRMVRDRQVPKQISQGYALAPDDSIHAYLGGKTLGRLIGDIFGTRAQQRAERIGRGAYTPIKKSFDWNQTVDNFYRTIAYLYGKRKKDHEYGIELANKVLQDWDAMLPIERTLIRNVFPFYGWSSHILRYTFGYPYDHPLRAAIVSNFARNEIEDWGTGLPKTFYQMFSLGAPDAQGTVKAISYRGVNPFADVANYFTLGGVINQLNPALGAVFESAGVSGITGKAELYPDLVYNQNTGQLEPRTPSFASRLIGGTVPQTELLSIIGLGPDDTKILREVNPEAFGARLWSAAGLPFYPKSFNKYERRALEELKRDRVRREVFNTALRTGDWGPAWEYADLRPLLRKVQESLPALEAGGYTSG